MSLIDFVDEEKINKFLICSICQEPFKKCFEYQCGQNHIVIVSVVSQIG